MSESLTVYLTPKEAAKLVGVNRETVYRWLRTGTLPNDVYTVRVGRKPRYRIDRLRFLTWFLGHRDGVSRVLRDVG